MEKNVHGSITSTRKNAHGINVKEQKMSTQKCPHKGGKNDHGKNVHVNNVQEIPQDVKKILIQEYDMIRVTNIPTSYVMALIYQN